MDIHTGRGNAIKILSRSLNALAGTGYSLAVLEGGNLRNAIPREAEAIISIDPSNEKNAIQIVENFQEDVFNEYETSDGGLKITLQASDINVEKVFTSDFRNKMINTLLALQHGVIAMSQDFTYLFET